MNGAEEVVAMEAAIMVGVKDQPSVPAPLWGRIRSGPLKVNSPFPLASKQNSCGLDRLHTSPFCAR